MINSMLVEVLLIALVDLVLVVRFIVDVNLDEVDLVLQVEDVDFVSLVSYV